ncbi:MAG TPA: hypothetical protein VN437_00245 [Rectinemataceae bacterium]|nr:hypothetical protein [Rectinemataceae bacterium]
MKKKTGLWIDHKKAIIVDIVDEKEEVNVILSKAEKQLRRSGETPLSGPYEAQKVPMSDSRQKELTGHLNIYYDSVIARIRNAESIVIFGPGEAKDELRKRLEKDNLGSHIAGVETADKMTDHQVVAKVRNYLPK